MEQRYVMQIDKKAYTRLLTTKLGLHTGSRPKGVLHSTRKLTLKIFEFVYSEKLRELKGKIRVKYR